MAESGSHTIDNQIDIHQILIEAQHRWLRPAEICELIQNYEKFSLAPEPANKPSSGSLFLYDRNELRFFRKDGHNWRKRRDGRTIREAHEKLKAGSVYVLQCYYAHGEENENFQRRTYWMLEGNLSHIALVHYREVQSSRARFNRNRGAEEALPFPQEPEEIFSNSEMDTSHSCSSHPSNYQRPSQTTKMNQNCEQLSEYEDAESEYSHQASTVFHSFLGLPKPRIESTSTELFDPSYHVSSSDSYQDKFPAFTRNGYTATAEKSKDCEGAGLTYEPHKNLKYFSENILENGRTEIPSSRLQLSFTTFQPKTSEHAPKQVQEDCPTSERSSSHLVRWPTDEQDQHPDVSLLYSVESGQINTKKQNDQPMQRNLPKLLSNTEHEYYTNLYPDDKVIMEGRSNIETKLPSLNTVSNEALRKNDSFNQWMSRELGDVNESSMQSNSGAYWDTVENENEVHDSSTSHVHLGYMFSPSLSHEQIFSIIDFSPSWAYEDSEDKVLISGRFLKNQQEAENPKWSCMFGDMEVPAEVIANGVLRCYTPKHKAGRVPFYVTHSNRLACSEVREFEYRAKHIQGVDPMHGHDANTSEALTLQLVKLLCLDGTGSLVVGPNSIDERSLLSSKICQLLKDESSEWDQMLKPTWGKKFSLESAKDMLLHKLLKEKLRVWLLQKVAEGGKGPGILDEHGQGVVHYAAALDYDWALQPSILAGINVNFRDVNGWTALHWAAFCGRERTVAALISLGAAPGVITDPCPKYPSGRTPADLASSNGHKGIAGYLAESSLSAHLEFLDFDNQEGKTAETYRAKAVQTAAERVATPHEGRDIHALSLKDSLAAVSNASQAAARIHEVFRVQSFQRKQLKELQCSDGKKGLSDEQALSLLAVKTSKPRPHDEHAAATRIQNKFRSWKGRKDFLIIRQRIVKIQAHVRGHQVRKNYRNIVWSVGILEKVILRWRRKGSGLRGFKPEGLNEGTGSQDKSVRENDGDFLKEGRKQTEERLQKALARVKSMVQYPEARDQYRRLLNVVKEMQEVKEKDICLDSSIETDDFDDLIDIEALLAEDLFMPT